MTFVVNMIPKTLSGETNQDSEPNLAIDPADPRRIAGSAFTPDPLAGTNAPIFVSVDGGQTWVLNNIVPSEAGLATGDISLAFGYERRLYAGILRRPGGLRLNILRTTDFTLPNAMTVLVDRTGSGVDQPYVEASRVFAPGAKPDRVYVGNNDFNGASGRTATVDVSLDGSAAAPPPPANFDARRIETRATSGQDMPPIRPAVHIDGTVYAAYFGGRPAGKDVVVARDDNWAAGTTQFAALLDSGDGLAGQRVATGVAVPFENFGTMGQERLVASDLSIAVDPRDSSRVWVAWGDRPTGTTNLTLHVRHSTDRGQTWSGDVRTVASAKAPVLAINTRGKVAFLYQALTGTAPNQRWATRVERSSDEFATFTTTVLADVPANAPAAQFLPYLGDYMDMKAAGKDFYGIFSANNTPDLANFPIGVTYQRNHDFTSHTLFNTDGVTPVPASIDPFFFNLTELAPEADAYVADWTDSATSYDLGAEPSVEPEFYTRSDVWNRLTNSPGAFDANNRPVNEDPRNGVGPLGRNYAFARIRRRGPGTPVAVNAHFMVSQFGTGSNFADAGTAADPTINFGPTDTAITMAAGYPWELPPTSSTHLCMAVEVSTAEDPVVQPSLLGRAPGWPASDLLVVNDNNKAQRNMGVGATATGGWLTWFALIHNAATIRRDIVLLWERTHGEGGGWLQAIGGKPKRLKGSGELVVPGLLPGESRWVRVALEGAAKLETRVVFNEMVGSAPINGFAISAQTRPLRDVCAYLLRRAISVYTRVTAFGLLDAAKLAETAEGMLTGGISEKRYVSFVRNGLEMDAEIVRQLSGRLGRGDPFGLSKSQRELATALESADVAAIQTHHGALLESIDAILTSLDQREGNLADVCQNLRWQADLFRSEKLARTRPAKHLVSASEEFSRAFAARKTTVDRYPELIAGMLDGLQDAAKAVKGKSLEEQVGAIRDSLHDPKALQRGHWEYLAALAEQLDG